MMSTRGILTIFVAMAACTVLPSCQDDKTNSKTEVTKTERKIAPSLLQDESGRPLESPYAENITFDNPSVRVNPEDDDELLIELDVKNGGAKTVKKLHIWADFYNRNGLKVADEGELLAHDLGIGDNSSPVPPHSSKRAIIELDSPENWAGGKMVITIDQLEIE